MPATRLDVIMYHYVRDLPRTRFPRIKGMLTADFERQIDAISSRYEMATLESALDFLAGRHRPQRDLCLLTFDDNLKEHYTDVLSILAPRKIQGIFFVVTGCLEEDHLLLVHKNHFLMAALNFGDYRRALLDRLTELSPKTDICVDESRATQIYRWDRAEVAILKYILNFHMGYQLRRQILDELFARHVGDEREFARQLYVNWAEARSLQENGMLVGGHSHRHLALAKLNEQDQQDDLATCASLLKGRLNKQELWPFSYPYGKPGDSFTATTSRTVFDLGFSCAFSTEVGSNFVGDDTMRLRRVDPKDMIL